MKNTGLYFGTFSAYEEYYAIGQSKEEVKTLLWKMYSRNFYGRPTKEDKATFEEEVSVEKFNLVEGFGYNTKFGGCYTLAKGRLKSLE